ncbi:putative dienelactone hydrolase [Sphingopyxis sp. OAS728]|uniref:alpha/beta hydrolase family protein n=1 Tax=Sphingopyxis sp. OAS728 TaxID=2663823 RepID=UPI00178A5C15|nr:hypothetical protein [Sphingopyxis sp. OAS728]MBE1529613.1 putative dienelactone hydrolase [Sphingopyxis sp. OAS728]
MTTTVTLPKPSGPWSVGVIDTEFTDINRRESFAPETYRRLPVRVWYPATAEDECRRPNVTPAERVHQVLPFLGNMTADADFLGALDSLTHAYENAAPLRGRRRPVLVFSHGVFSCPQTSTSLLVHLASHGYVVFSIAHPYVDTATFHENGDIIPLHEELLKDAIRTMGPESISNSPYPADRLETVRRNCRESPLAAQYIVWQEDFIHVVDRVSCGDLPGRAAILAQIIDPDRMGTFGLSFGGSAAAAAQRDTRIKAAINLDGGTFDAEMIDRDSRVPLLIMHSDRSAMPTIYPHSEFFYERLASAGTKQDLFRVEILGSTHLAFTDLCLLNPEQRSDPVVAAILGSIDGKRMTEIVHEFCTSFFDFYLKEEGHGLNPSFRSQNPEVVDIDLGHIREWAEQVRTTDERSETDNFA